MRFVAAIPARYASTRFPGKPLALIGGKAMIVRVYEQVKRAKVFDDIVVATDDQRIAAAVKAVGGKAVMTPPELPTGTDRIAFALKKTKYDWIMNVQGDEPFVPSVLLKKLVDLAKQIKGPAIITAATPIRQPADFTNSNVVKVVLDNQGRALYFSRAPIPDISRIKDKRPQGALRHIGIYLYHKTAFKRFVTLAVSPLEHLEKLEQLRALQAGLPIYVVTVDYDPVNVDVPSDIRKAETCLRARK